MPLLSFLALSGPREYLSVGFVGRLLSFHDWICPLLLGLNSLCYYLYIVGDSGLGAGGRCQPAQPRHQLGTPALPCSLGDGQQDASGRVGTDEAYEQCYFPLLVLLEEII